MQPEYHERRFTTSSGERCENSERPFSLTMSCETSPATCADGCFNRAERWTEKTENGVVFIVCGQCGKRIGRKQSKDS